MCRLILEANLEDFSRLSNCNTTQQDITSLMERNRIPEAMRNKAKQYVTYEEVGNKEHWWWDSENTNDGGVMNDPKMRALYRSMARSSIPSLPNNGYRVISFNPSTFEGKGGVQIMQVGHDTKICTATRVFFKPNVWVTTPFFFSLAASSIQAKPNRGAHE